MACCLGTTLSKRASNGSGRIVDAIKDEVPVIVFSKGMHEYHELLTSTGANVLGVTWTTDMRKVRDTLPKHVGVQGNMDPVILSTNQELTRKEATRILESMRGTDGFIFNLGHGIQPSALPQNMLALTETVSSFS